MTWHTWWLFVGIVVPLCGSPGPNMLHVMTRSLHFGARRSIPAMAGCLVAVIIAFTASVGGLSALLLASPRLFDVLRYAGIAYLIFIGIRTWRGGGAPVDVGAQPLHGSLSPAQMFRGGLAIGLSNPKLLLFAAAFLPQFVDQTAPKAPQFAILVLTFAVVEMTWYVTYSLGGQSLAQHLAKPALKRAFDRLTGGIFIGFGAALLRTNP